MLVYQFKLGLLYLWSVKFVLFRKLSKFETLVWNVTNVYQTCSWTHTIVHFILKDFGIKPLNFQDLKTNSVALRIRKNLKTMKPHKEDENGHHKLLTRLFQKKAAKRLPNSNQRIRENRKTIRKASKRHTSRNCSKIERKLEILEI